MGMNIGIITIRDGQFHTNERLMAAAANQGHRIALVHPYRVWPVLEEGTATLMGLPPHALPDVVMPRQGAMIGSSCLILIEHIKGMGIPIVNDIPAIRTTLNQFLTLQALSFGNIPFPNTLFVNDPRGFYRAIDRLNGWPVVVKITSSMQGNGVFLVDSKQAAATMVERYLKPREGLLVQQFIPPQDREDIRVMVIGREVHGAMTLDPLPGDFRANYHLTKKAREKTLTPELKQMALDAATAVDLDIAGVDMIVSKAGRPYVIEVNYAPGFEGLEAATGLDVAGSIVAYVASKYGKKGDPSP